MSAKRPRLLFWQAILQMIKLQTRKTTKITEITIILFFNCKPPDLGLAISCSIMAINMVFVKIKSACFETSAFFVFLNEQFRKRFLSGHSFDNLSQEWFKGNDSNLNIFALEILRLVVNDIGSENLGDYFMESLELIQSIA